MKSTPSSLYLYLAAGLAVAGLLVFVVVRNRSLVVPSVHDGFAQCLAEKGVTMYGAWWCPHCKEQKELFGNAFRYVNYVECSPGGSKTMSQECRDAGVEGYPTWKFADGTKRSGEQTFEELSKLSSCPLAESTGDQSDGS